MHTSSRVSLFVFLFRTSAILASLWWLMTGQRIYATSYSICVIETEKRIINKLYRICILLSPEG